MKVDAKTYIYVLRDPDTKAVRYVGRTKNPRQRYSGHMNDKYAYKPKADWINSLLERGKKPQMDTIVACDGSAKKREAYYINLFVEQGCDLLQSVDHIPGNWPCKQRSQEVRRLTKTHCKNGHEFTDENTRTLKSGVRLCCACTSEYNNKYRRNQKMAEAMQEGIRG